MDLERIREILEDAQHARDQIESVISDLEDLIDDHEKGAPDERAALHKWNEWAKAEAS